MNSKECMICGESMKKVSHTVVPCEYCEFEACRSCYVTYFKTEGLCKCMDKKNCDKEWSRRHLAKHMTKHFMSNDYKKMQEKRCLDTQKAMLPATMDLVAERVEKKRIQKEILRVENDIRKLMQYKHNLQIELHNGGSYVNPKANTYVRPCQSENCRGFLNSSWKCGLCSKYTCKDCHVILGEAIDLEHVCDEGLKATATLLNKDTKPCPKCQEGIFKIDGCDQMWCTKCHTAFSWKTGRIETQIHNPHYYEYMRRTAGSVPRNPGDIVGGCVDEGNITNMDAQLIYQMSRMCEVVYRGRSVYDPSGNRKHHEELYNTQKELNRCVENVVRSRIHVERVDIRRYVTDNEGDNRELRIEFLMNKITEKEFTQKLFRKQKDTEKKEEYTRILNMYITVANDMLRRLVHTYRDYDTKVHREIRETDINIVNEVRKIIESFVKEAEGLEDHVNELFEEASKVYNNKALRFRAAKAQNRSLGIIV